MSGFLSGLVKSSGWGGGCGLALFAVWGGGGGACLPFCGFGEAIGLDRGGGIGTLALLGACCGGGGFCEGALEGV